MRSWASIKPGIQASVCWQVVVLYVDQEESIRRQCMRAQMASVHNRRVQVRTCTHTCMHVQSKRLATRS